MCVGLSTHLQEMRRQASVKEKKKDASKHFKKKYRDLLFGDAERGQQTEAEHLKEEVERLRAENAKLLDRISTLEIALCSRIFQTGLIISL